MAELREKRRVPGTDADGERERERQREQRRKRGDAIERGLGGRDVPDLVT